MRAEEKFNPPTFIEKKVLEENVVSKSFFFLMTVVKVRKDLRSVHDN